MLCECLKNKREICSNPNIKYSGTNTGRLSSTKFWWRQRNWQRNALNRGRNLLYKKERVHPALLPLTSHLLLPPHLDFQEMDTLQPVLHSWQKKLSECWNRNSSKPPKGTLNWSKRGQRGCDPNRRGQGPNQRGWRRGRGNWIASLKTQRQRDTTHNNHNNNIVNLSSTEVSKYSQHKLSP